MTNDTITKAKENMDKSVAIYQKELGNIRAGVADASLLERAKVDYYGMPIPLIQMSSVTIPEAHVLLVAPCDKFSLDDIEHVLLASNSELTPANDGNVIRLVIPQLTGERREEIAKQVGKQAEQAEIAIRSVRHEAVDSLEKQEKDGDITEGEQKCLEEDVQKATGDATKRADQLADKKRKEITKG